MNSLLEYLRIISEQVSPVPGKLAGILYEDMMPPCDTSPHNYLFYYASETGELYFNAARRTGSAGPTGRVWTTIRPEGNTDDEDWINISNCMISKLSLPDAPVTGPLTIVGNEDLKRLDVSSLTGLERLNCHDNALTSLTLINSLKMLNAGGNQLASLNLSGLISLEYLTLSGNPMTSITLTGLSSLKVLQCDFCSFTSLDLSETTALTVLDCSDNPITALSGLPATLERLCCNNCSLAALDISSLINLSFLEVYGNALSQSEVNAILAALVDGELEDGAVVLSGGTNGAPSGQGATDKTTLEGRGWTVTTN